MTGCRISAVELAVESSVQELSAKVGGLSLGIIAVAEGTDNNITDDVFRDIGSSNKLTDPVRRVRLLALARLISPVADHLEDHGFVLHASAQGQGLTSLSLPLLKALGCFLGIFALERVWGLRVGALAYDCGCCGEGL